MQDTTRTLPVRFVGSGSEYFRIWIVNLLLILVTLGLYYPFAKVRKLRYFHGATEIGEHPMSFHADPWKMLRGYLLVGAMVAMYTLATHFSETAGVIAFVIVAALWPALWHSSLRFRLANTGWRGLRFRFTGRLIDAYKVMLPFAGLALVFILIGLVAGPRPGQEPGQEPSLGAVLWVSLLPLLVMAAMPAMLWLLRRYQHNHYALGGERSGFTATLGSFYGVFVLALLMLFGIFVVFGIVAAILLPAVLAGLRGGDAGEVGAASFIGPMVLFMLAYVAVLALVGAFIGARLQNLVWNATRSQHIGFASQLGVAALAKLTLKNWLLIVLTIGLYFPFAAVSMAKLRLESVGVLFDADPEVLVSVGSHLNESAAGDAAGDLFGFDIGL
jgi:uncharacterized membrane protein YjgN (DUF898 family)